MIVEQYWWMKDEEELFIWEIVQLAAAGLSDR